MSVLLEQYRSEMIPKLQASRSYGNVMQVPKLEKIVLNCGISSQRDRDMFANAQLALSDITGQRPVITKTRMNIANFKLREGMNVGVCVTLRKERMYDFYYRLTRVALPRVRDFRGVAAKAFDGRGNYSMGLEDLTIFTEVNPDKLKYTIGMSIAIVTTAATNEEGLELLTMLGMPFEK